MNQAYYNGDFWQCVTATAAGESPSTHPAKWRKIRFPSKWRWALAQFTYAELLTADGQTDKASIERNRAKAHEGAGLNDLIAQEAEEERNRQCGRGRPARVNTGRTRPVPASVVLDDAYGLMNWDASNLDNREKQDARRAFSRALQQMWEAWWWQELMKCEQRSFADILSQTNLADFTVGASGFVCLWPQTDKYYYVQDDNPGVNPTDADGNVNVATGLWVELAFDTLYERWDINTTYERGVNDTVSWQGRDWVLRGAATALGTEPSSNNGWFCLPLGLPALPYLNNAGVMVGPFGPIRSVSKYDPRSASNPQFYELDLTGGGTRVVSLTVGLPWVWWRLVTPQITGDEWSATATYDATDEQDIVFDDTSTSYGSSTTAVTAAAGVTELYFVTGSPEGVTTATAPAMAYSEAGSVWLKTGTGSNSTGWVLILGDGS